MGKTLRALGCLILFMIALQGVPAYAHGAEEVSVKKVGIGPNTNLILMEDGRLVFDRREGLLDTEDMHYTYITNDEGETGWKDVASNGSSVYAIKEDGTMWATGFNDVGQLGAGDTESREAFVQIGKGQNWRTVSSNYGHAVALTESGTLWAWGFNSSGQLGDGTQTNRSVPTRIGRDSDWKEVFAGSYHTMAVKQDGSVWAWGASTALRLNMDTRKNITKPVQIFDNLDYRKISVGNVHTLVIMADRTLWGWGLNQSGQLGTDAFEESLYENISNDHWLDISASDNSSYAIKADGTLWSVRNGFTLLSNDTDWASLTHGPDSDGAGGNVHAVKTSGKLYSLRYSTVQEKTAFNKAFGLDYLWADPNPVTIRTGSKTSVLEACLINGENYVKLRDLAALMNGSEKQFNIGWDGSRNTVTVSPRTAYVSVGGELPAAGPQARKKAVPSEAKLLVSGEEAALSAYHIEGNNYYRLRDMAQSLDFNVTWDAARKAIVVDPKASYIPE